MSRSLVVQLGVESRPWRGGDIEIVEVEAEGAVYRSRSPGSCLSSPDASAPSPLVSPLRKTHKLRIPRSPIRPDPILCKSTLGVYPSRFVEVDSPALHDLLDLALAGVVKPGAGVARCDVGTEIEGGRGEAVFDVRGEGGGESGVEVGGPGEGVREAWGGDGGQEARGEGDGHGRHEGLPEGAS